MSTKSDRNGLDGKADPWRENTIRDLKRKGFKKVVYEPNRGRVRFNTGIGNDQFRYRPKEIGAKEVMAELRGDGLLPWLRDVVEMLENQKSSWEAARLPCEENWAKPKDKRDKDVAPPGEIEEALERIEDISYAINQCLSDDTLTEAQKRRMVDMFKAGMSFREFLNIPARAHYRAHQRHGEKRSTAELTHWKKRLREHLETLEERPTPTQVVNLCEDFTKAGKKMSDGVKCNGETKTKTITKHMFSKAIIKLWKLIHP